jgi:hypothetical protein
VEEGRFEDGQKHDMKRFLSLKRNVFLPEIEPLIFQAAGRRIFFPELSGKARD